MPRVQSIQMRVLLWGWGVLIVGLAVAFWRYSASLDDETARDFERDTLTRLETVQWLLERNGPFQEPRDRQDFLHSLAASMGMRISLIQGAKVLADSSRPFDDLDKMDDHSTRPEVAGALGGELGQATRHSTTLDRDMIYMARKLPDKPGQAETVLRLAAPVSQVRMHMQRMRWALLAAVIPLLLGSGILLYLLSRTITAGIAQFTEAAQAIGEGDYRRRILFYPAAEFQPLAEAINRMAKKIKKNVKVIENQRGELWAMFEGMTEGVMVLDTSGHILHVNPALSAIFPRAHEFITFAAQEKNITLEVEELPAGLPNAAADPDGLLQIVDNLLDNAIKYSPQGTTVHIAAASDGQSMTLRFRDQGPGIGPEDQKRVFERFFRADNNDVDGAGSAGLGLAICRHIARNYGGEVWVESPVDQESGSGSEFIVRLPVA